MWKFIPDGNSVIFWEDENVELMLILRPLFVDTRLDLKTKLFSTFLFLQLDNTVQNYSFHVVQEHKITDLKPAIIKVYDYYHPGKHIPSCSPFSSFFFVQKTVPRFFTILSIHFNIVSIQHWAKCQD